MKIERPDPIAWHLFAMIDEEADALEATVGDVLDVAAIIVAGYMLRMRADLRARGFPDRERGDDAARKVFAERIARFMETDAQPVH